jgi:amino acid permease
MKTFKTILFVALLIYHIATIVVISIGKNDLNFLFDLFKQMDAVQYSSIVGLVLFLGVIFLFFQVEKSKSKLIEKHENEINQFKAKLYDKKETESSSAAPRQPETRASKEELSKNEEEKSTEKKSEDSEKQP